MSALPTALARHGIKRVSDNIPEGFEVDGAYIVKWLLFDFGDELRHELGRRCGGQKMPSNRQPVVEVVETEKRLSDEEEAQLLALLEKQAGRR